MEKVRQSRENKVKDTNTDSFPNLTPSKRLGKETDKIISFEHINVNGINPYDEFAELTNTIGILEKMEAGVYCIVENQWNTNSPVFSKYMKDTIKRDDKYTYIET